jgi:hypothetical protein
MRDRSCALLLPLARLPPLSFRLRLPFSSPSHLRLFDPVRRLPTTRGRGGVLNALPHHHLSSVSHRPPRTLSHPELLTGAVSTAAPILTSFLSPSMLPSPTLESKSPTRRSPTGRGSRGPEEFPFFCPGSF